MRGPHHQQVPPRPCRCSYWCFLRMKAVRDKRVQYERMSH
ncbi:hypothetical protein SLI_4571 [Streptomyces lividans 1326]|uniref:Uncharacterized protein n=1 Tax=Streptomyces lividans 1326 TaxID=1200984 RepID=A0A7U9DSG9_STRLI|nr:hypothetical protein SLI_4571 [Streptomyces lividans 1326]